MNVAGIGTAKRIVGTDGNAAPLEDFERVVNINLIGTYNVIRLAAAAMREARPAAGRRARRDRQHRLGRRLRRPGRPEGLRPSKGGVVAHDAAAGTRPRADRHPRLHDRAGPLRDAAAAARAAAGSAGVARRLDPVPEAPGRTRASSPRWLP